MCFSLQYHFSINIYEFLYLMTFIYLWQYTDQFKHTQILYSGKTDRFIIFLFIRSNSKVLHNMYTSVLIENHFVHLKLECCVLTIRLFLIDLKMFAMVLWYECIVHLSYVITIFLFYNNMFYITYHSDFFFHTDLWHSIKVWFDFEDFCSKDAKKKKWSTSCRSNRESPVNSPYFIQQ